MTLILIVGKLGLLHSLALYQYGACNLILGFSKSNHGRNMTFKNQYDKPISKLILIRRRHR